jgi:hypothetical protein
MFWYHRYMKTWSISYMIDIIHDIMESKLWYHSSKSMISLCSDIIGLWYQTWYHTWYQTWYHSQPTCTVRRQITYGIMKDFNVSIPSCLGELGRSIMYIYPNTVISNHHSYEHLGMLLAWSRLGEHWPAYRKVQGLSLCTLHIIYGVLHFFLSKS